MSGPGQTANAEAFIAANKDFGVVSGAAIGNGGEGARYTLKDGRTFTLSRAECAFIGMPVWDFGE